MICARCGQNGHWARSCTNPPDQYALSRGAGKVTGMFCIGFSQATCKLELQMLADAEDGILDELDNLFDEYDAELESIFAPYLRELVVPTFSSAEAMPELEVPAPPAVFFDQDDSDSDSMGSLVSSSSDDDFRYQGLMDTDSESEPEVVDVFDLADEFWHAVA